MFIFFSKLFTLLLILLILPFLIFVFLFLLLHGINPIYVSNRVGKNQKIFSMYKFRSLKPNLVDGYLTSSQDESFFYFSNFLRNSKIDELPQLINIILGDMNWVGPRANDPRIVKKYKEEDKIKIFSINPGLTDFSTLIYGIKSDNVIINKDEISYFENIEKKKIFFRNLYVEKKSMLLDCKVILLTIVSYLGLVKVTENNFEKYFKFNIKI